MSVSGLRKSFGERVVLDGVSLEVEAGSLTAILGASGSGKTTLLRLIAGFDRADEGTIALGGQMVEGPEQFVPPERRRIGYVPQEGALFPHLTVAGNVAFGLRSAEDRQEPGDDRRARGGAARAGRARRLREAAAAPPLGRRAPARRARPRARRAARRSCCSTSRSPRSTSSCARACAARSSTCSPHAGATAILVTHDQDEALSIADRVAVLQHGTIVQCAEPHVLYTRPVNGEVARFVGHGNLLLGRLENGVVQSVLGEIAVELDVPASEPCAVGVLVRPEQIELAGRRRRRAARRRREPRVPRARRARQRPDRPARVGAAARRAARVRDPRPAARPAGARDREPCRAAGPRDRRGLAHARGVTRRTVLDPSPPKT